MSHWIILDDTVEKLQGDNCTNGVLARLAAAAETAHEMSESQNQTEEMSAVISKADYINDTFLPAGFTAASLESQVEALEGLINAC